MNPICTGPLVHSVLESNVDGNLSSLYFMRSERMNVFNIPDCQVSRCGYTGEDGVEVIALFFEFTIIASN